MKLELYEINVLEHIKMAEKEMCDYIKMEFDHKDILIIRQNKYLSNLKDSVIRIKKGAYGNCRICNEFIGEKILLAIPNKTICIKCFSQIEIN